MTPFSITLFATTGDPEGIRHLNKSNWSGTGVVFPKDKFNDLKNEVGASQAGVYILVVPGAEPMVYIGESDDLGARLINHVRNKKDWSWGVYFFDSNLHIGKTEALYLESQLIRMATESGNAVVLNKNKKTTPTISLANQATADAFLQDMLLTLPMIGINAFEKAEPIAPEEEQDVINEQIDTIVVPAHEEGFNRVFLGENCWYAIRISTKRIDKIKYIAAYRVAPRSSITHIAKVDEIIPYEDTGKYKVVFKNKAEEIPEISRQSDSRLNLQNTRYALYENIIQAKSLDEIWQ